MTHEIIDRHALLAKTTDADFLRELIGAAAQRLLAVEGEALTGAAHGRTSQRTGSYFPGFLEPRRMAEKALTAVIREI